jgi:hypothetical protein
MDEKRTAKTPPCKPGREEILLKTATCQRKILTTDSQISWDDTKSQNETPEK